MDATDVAIIDKIMKWTPPHKAPTPEKRSAMGEIWSQLKAGAFSDLPRMAGRAMQYASSPGNPVYNTGKGLVEDANAIATLPEMQPGDTTGRPVVSALSQGARMVPQSIAPAVGAGLVLSGVGAPAGVALIGGSALAAMPAGMAQAQDTYEKGLAKHGLTAEQAAAMPEAPRVQEAINAGRMTGAIEWGGETAGGALAGRFMGIGGNMEKSAIGRILNKGEQNAAQTTLRSFTNPGTIGKFAGNAVETAGAETLIEMGQGAAEATVEQHYGYDQQTPWSAATDAIAPTLGMSALLLPFGIPAHASHAVKMNAITRILENPTLAPEARSQAAEIIYDELAKQSPDAAVNFAAHSFDAIHGDQDTGSAPYGLTLDDSVLQPLTPRALQEQQSAEPEGTLARAVSARAPQLGLPYGATDLLQETALATSTIDQPAAQPADINAIQQHASTFTAPGTSNISQAETPAAGLPAQAPVIPTDSLHGVLQHFIKSGQEKTSQSGETSHVWEKPQKTFLDKAVTNFLQPATAQGLVSQDASGVFTVNTDQGTLRIMPPTEATGNYRLEYHNSPGLQPGQTTTADTTNKPVSVSVPDTANQATTQPTDFDTALQQHVNTFTAPGTSNISQAETPAAGLPVQAPVITRQSIEAAFPGQTVTPHPESYSVSLKNGKALTITHAKEIFMDPESFEAGYGYKPNESHKATASFSIPGQYALDRTAVITLTDQGAKDIHHETFHAAMYMALNQNQRDAILKKFGTEEAAADEYQRLRDNVAFTKPRRHHLFLQTIYNFFAKIHTMLDPSRQIMKDVASGKVWDTPATVEKDPQSVTVKYSIAEIRDKTTAVKDRLVALANKSTFVKQDIAPAMKATGEGIAAAWDGIKAAVNPMDRTAAAEETGRILIEGMGHLEHGKEKFITELNKAAMQSNHTTTKLYSKRS